MSTRRLLLSRSKFSNSSTMAILASIGDMGMAGASGDGLLDLVSGEACSCRQCLHSQRSYRGSAVFQSSRNRSHRAAIGCAGTPVLCVDTVSYTHLRAHETPEHLVCRLLLEKKKKNNNNLD
eukprot:TRINITY_DN1288_c0_g1_i2.p3 TRINITY_DN1288_c0_g1~~TRINITY_DN1288_c0_g1_i2.p3  ORF type:complete len:122 (-),score=24.46 TRINITY_DN1288_c0_g1_i2:39-404(-)